MNANDILALMAGIPQSGNQETRAGGANADSDIEEINYDDAEAGEEEFERGSMQSFTARNMGLRMNSSANNQVIQVDEEDVIYDVDDDVINQLPAITLPTALRREPRPPARPRPQPARLVHRELEGLTFYNPGEGMSKMLPDYQTMSNGRPRREVQQQSAAAPIDRENFVHHDKYGRLVIPQKAGEPLVVDICDCCDVKCTGCQWPCSNCKSRKCILKCRQNRNEIIANVEEMYTVTGSKEHYSCENPNVSFSIRESRR